MSNPTKEKYNPKNFSPDNLFRAPTSATHGELLYLVDQLSRTLEGTSRVKERRVLVGTELEMIFFNPDQDPAEAYRKFGKLSPNPNYLPDHSAKIELLKKFGNNLRLTRPGEFMEVEGIGKISLEFHTAPQRVNNHLSSMERFAELLRKKCRELNVLPVVHSQHIHLSMRNNPMSNALKGTIMSKGIMPDSNVVRNAFSRVNPLVLLPEEWDYRDMNPYYAKSDGIASLTRHDLDHPEFRRLSSEYAFDPILNLLLSLRAMHAGCLAKSSVTEMKHPRSFEVAVTRMNQDSELANFFGQSTLSALSMIVGQYPAVSKREINIDQVHNK
jgi:hypothetical protein